MLLLDNNSRYSSSKYSGRKNEVIFVFGAYLLNIDSISLPLLGVPPSIGSTMNIRLRPTSPKKRISFSNILLSNVTGIWRNLCPQYPHLYGQPRVVS